MSALHNPAIDIGLGRSGLAEVELASWHRTGKSLCLLKCRVKNCDWVFATRLREGLAGAEQRCLLALSGRPVRKWRVSGWRHRQPPTSAVSNWPITSGLKGPPRRLHADGQSQAPVS